MFSWSKKKENKRRERPQQDSDVNEFGVKLDKGPNDKELEAELKGLTGVDSLPEDDFSLNEGEDDVETELQRLIGGKGKKQSKKPPTADEPLGDISQLTADIDLGDEDVEVDENDEELLGELLELTNPDEADAEGQDMESDSGAECEDNSSGGDSDILKILKERLKLYKTAEEKAKENKENSRARRFARGIKTLEDLLKKAKQGKAVSPDDIPPVIAINLKPAPPPPSAVPENVNGATEEFEESSERPPADELNSPPSETVDVMITLRERLQLYHTAEAKAKESGETTRARRFARGIKTLEGLIKQAQAGKEIAPDDIPPVVPLNLKPAPPVPVQPSSEENEEEVEDETGNVILTEASEAPEEPEEPEEPEQQQEERTLEEVLLERLKMYKTAEAKAKESGETSRARRFGRGIKTLQDLIKQASAGKPINPEDIPPEIALNLKPAPPPIVLNEEENRPEPSIEREDLVRSSDIPHAPLSFTAVDDVDVDELGDEDIPITVLEGLEQRVRFYSKFQEKARQDGDSDLADQNERIVRVYMNAISTFKKGEYVDVLNLPNPRGCPPIPIPFYVP